METKINILYTIPNFKTAGSQFVVQALYKHIDRLLFQPYVLVEKFPTHFPDCIKEEERLFITEKVGTSSYIFELATLLKKKQIKVLHSWDYKSNALEALACRKAGVSYLYTKKNNAWSKRWFLKSVLSKHIAYDNPEMKKSFFNHWLLASKTTFVPHGVDMTVFKPLPKNREKGKFTIGCIGVIGSNKNQLFLLKALTKLPAHFQVFLYGKADENYKNELIAFITSNELGNRVFFKGIIANNEIPKAMSLFDAVVLPSINEGLPLTIIEAMACGVPVLSSNSGGGARYLLEDVASNCIFSLEKPSKLLKQLMQLENTESVLYKKLSAYGIERVQLDFSIEKEVAAYKMLYLKFK